MTSPQETTLHHNPAGFEVPVPEDWQTVLDAQPDMPLIALEPPRADDSAAFRANLVVTVGDVGGLSFRDWQRGTDELLPRTLKDWLLIDLAHIAVGTLEGARRLGHHTSPDGQALTLDQWVVLAGDTGYTLSITTATDAYSDLAEDISAIGSGFRLDSAIEGAAKGDASS